MEIDRIYKGDCLEGMAQLPNSSVDIVVTDPPYLLPIRQGGEKVGTNVLSNLLKRGD